MRRRGALFALTILTLVACNYNRMVYQTRDPETGRIVPLAYTNRFETTVIAGGGSTELVLSLRAEKRRIPLLYELFTIFSSGAGDLSATGLIEAQVRNLSNEAIHFELTQIAHIGRQPNGLPQAADISPGSLHRFELGAVEVLRHATELPFEIAFSVNGQPERWTLAVPREVLEPEEQEDSGPPVGAPAKR